METKEQQIFKLKKDLTLNSTLLSPDSRVSIIYRSPWTDPIDRAQVKYNAIGRSMDDKTLGGSDAVTVIDVLSTNL
jgi:hypothetical protein